MKKFNKKLLVFGLPILALALVSAAVLSYFGIWTGTFGVTQSVVVEDDSFTGTYSLVAGETVIDCDTDGNGYSVKNHADVDIPIQFGTTCRNVAGFDDLVRSESFIDWTAIGGGPECNGIETEIYGILKLTKKTTGWQPTGQSGDEITIRYTIVGDTFEYKVISGSIPSSYELVYARDKQDRFDPGEYATIFKKDDIKWDLPRSDDWNAIAEPGYCNGDNTFDSYEHCRGAKIWVIPTSDIGAVQTDDSYKLTWANMWNYYYETDLIVYSDDTNNKITLPANGGGFNFCVKNDFALNLEADTYTITTEVQPVTVTP